LEAEERKLGGDGYKKEINLNIFYKSKK